LLQEVGLDLGEGGFGSCFNTGVGSDDGGRVLVLLDKHSVRKLGFILLRSEGESAEHTDEVSRSDVSAVEVGVAELGKATESVLGGNDVLVFEGVLLGHMRLEEGSRLGQVGSKHFLGGEVGEHTDTVVGGLLEGLIFANAGLGDLDVLRGELGKHSGVLVNRGV